MWMSILAGTVLLAIAAGVAGVCHHYEKHYYSELGCRPETIGEDGCPINYDCNSLIERNQSKCYYQGGGFDEGHIIPPSDNCLISCRCSPSYPITRSKLWMAFSCITVRCVETDMAVPAPGCHRTYEHGKCCHINDVCVSDDGGGEVSRPVCKYKNQVYQVGQKFYPDEEHCLKCICHPGFNGSFVEPFCQKMTCSLELRYGRRMAIGCIPVFYGENGCCPKGWRCPEKSDTVVPASSSSNKTKMSDSGPMCQFGGLEMQVGERLSPSGQWPNTECECRIPPHSICIQKKKT